MITNKRLVKLTALALTMLLTVSMCVLASAETASAAGSLQGKSVLVEGDSIQWGFGKFIATAARSMGASRVKNASRNGATLAQSKRKIIRRNSTYYRISQMSAADLRSYDYVIISTGTNDYYGFYKVKPGTADSTDIHTTAGGLNGVIRKIRTEAPDTKIVVVTPIHRFAGRKNCDNRKGSYSKKTLNDYRNVITAAAGQYDNVYIIQGTDISRPEEMNKRRNSLDGLHPVSRYAKKVLAPRFTAEFCAKVQ